MVLISHGHPVRRNYMIYRYRTTIGWMLLIFILVIVTYYGTWNLFFLQDEWGAFGKFMYANTYGWQSLIRVSGFHFIPLTSLFNAMLFTVFGVNYPAFAWTGLLLHTVNAYLLAHLTKQLTASSFIGLLAGILFATFNTPEQAVTSAAVIPSVLPATTCVLLSAVFFYRYLGTANRSALAASSLFVLVGLLFKEDTIFLFAYYPCLYFIINRRGIGRMLLTYGIPAAVYAILRYTVLTYSVHSNYQGDALSADFALHMVRTFIARLPSALSASFIPASWVTVLSQRINSMIHSDSSFFVYVRFIFGTVKDLNPQHISSVLSGTGSMLVMGISMLIYHHLKPHTRMKPISLAVFAFIVMSYLPYAALPGYLTMESRHYYIPSLGSSLLLAMAFGSWIGKNTFGTLRYIGIIVFAAFVFGNIYQTRQIIRSVYQVRSDVVRTFLSYIRTTYRNIPKRAVFLSEGDPVPLQFGPGYMIMFALSDQQPYEMMLKQSYLWSSDGYATDGNIGLGYVASPDEFREIYRKNGLRPDEVYSFSYDAGSDTYTDSSQTLRQSVMEGQL